MNRFSFEQIMNDDTRAHALILLDKNILWRNEAFNEMFGFSKEDPVTVIDICVEMESASAVMATLLTGACERIKMDKQYRRKDKTIFWGRVEVILARDKDGIPLAFFVGIEDITGKREKTSTLSGAVNDLISFLDQKATKKGDLPQG